MARDYGFRVFKLEIYANQQKGKDPLPLGVGSHGQGALMGLLDHAASLGPTFLEAKQPDDPDEPRMPNVSITVAAGTYVTDALVHFEVSTGEVGGHKHAVTQDGEPQSLAEASAERGFFATLLFPRSDEGASQALLVLETHKGGDVKGRLFPFLNRLSRQLKREAVAAEDDAREEAKRQGTAVPAKTAHEKYLFEVRQIADSDYLYRLLKEAKSATAVFTESVPTSSGGQGTRAQKTLTYSLLTDEQRLAAGDTGRKWFKRRGKPQAANEPHPDAIAELAAAVNLNQDEVNDYDEVCVRITSKSGESVTVRPTEARDMFTYPISDGQPSVVYYYEAIAAKVAELAQTAGIEVDVIESSEVEECLIDSTSAPSSQG